MQAPTIPPNEAKRLAALYSTRLLDTAPEAMFDRITRMATRALKVPVSLVSLVDHEVQWFKSCCGLDLVQTSRDASFCGHALLSDEVLIIPDALADSRFADNPLVLDKPFIRAYAGLPLHSIEGMRVGTLCVLDHVPRQFGTDEIAMLGDLAQAAEELIQQRQFAVASANHLRLSRIADTSEQDDLRRTALEHLLMHDVATGLPNSTLFTEQLGQRIEAWKSGPCGGMVALIDVKLPESRALGHGRHSDELILAGVCRRLLSVLRAHDLIARMEGNRFAVALSDDLSGTASGLLAKIVECVVLPVHSGPVVGVPTCRIGFSSFMAEGDSVDFLIQRAYAALNHVAGNSASCIQAYREEHWLHARKRLSLEAQLQRAYDQRQFVLHYQPKVNLRSGQITGMEALIRWEHPEDGLISPAHFIPLAEETGLIVPIGDWVLTETCRQLGQWRKDGIKPVPVAINFSSEQFLNEAVVARVTRALDEYQIPPDWLEIELTESVSMRNLEISTRHMRQLRDLGVSIAIDDFGTGYSSLSYLKKLPISKVKIDRSFVKDIVESNESLAIVQAVIAMAHRMGLEVVAEGVETKDQLAFLSINRCDEMQGYYFSKPLAAKACAELLVSGRGLTVHNATQAIVQSVFGG